MNKKFAEVFVVSLAAVWVLSVVSLIIQLTSMTNNVIPFIVGAVLILAIVFLHIQLYKVFLRPKKYKYRKYFAYAYAGVHFIPIGSQIIGLKQPGFDNLIAFFIGITILVLLEKN